MEMKSLPHEEKRLQSLIQRYAGVPSWIAAPCMAMEALREQAAKVDQSAVKMEFPQIVKTGWGLTFAILLALTAPAFAADPGFVISERGFVISEPTLAPAPFCECDLVGGCKCIDCTCNLAKPKPVVSVVKQNTGAVALPANKRANPYRATAPTKQAGQHSHRCASCGYVWHHFAGGSHVCSRCGKTGNYQQYSGPVSRSSGCANGQCGTTGRQRIFSRGLFR